jgi:hypothetical protein
MICVCKVWDKFQRFQSGSGPLKKFFLGRLSAIQHFPFCLSSFVPVEHNWFSIIYIYFFLKKKRMKSKSLDTLAIMAAFEQYSAENKVCHGSPAGTVSDT